MRSDTRANLPQRASGEAGEPVRIIHQDLPCKSCGYNLRTARLDGICPECGTTVDETLTIGRPPCTRLHPLRAEGYDRWMRRLARACLLMLLVPLGQIPSDGHRLQHYQATHRWIAWTLGCVAMWLLAGRPATPLTDGLGTTLRIGLRICALAALPLPILVRECIGRPLYPSNAGDVVVLVLCYLMNLAAAVGCILFFAYLAQLLHQMLRPVLATCAMISGVLLVGWTALLFGIYRFRLPPAGWPFVRDLNFGESLSPWMAEMLHRLPERAFVVQPPGAQPELLHQVALAGLLWSIPVLIAARGAFRAAADATDRNRPPHRMEVVTIASTRALPPEPQAQQLCN